jgi:hypothetical protein
MEHTEFRTNGHKGSRLVLPCHREVREARRGDPRDNYGVDCLPAFGGAGGDQGFVARFADSSQ